jgi:hypothetical protein
MGQRPGQQSQKLGWRRALGWPWRNAVISPIRFRGPAMKETGCSRDLLVREFPTLGIPVACDRINPKFSLQTPCVNC